MSVSYSWLRINTVKNLSYTPTLSAHFVYQFWHSAANPIKHFGVNLLTLSLSWTTLLSKTIFPIAPKWCSQKLFVSKFIAKKFNRISSWGKFQ
jgi:hypothetical protein